ncbi:YbhB/YbcL family Raf kinase inhibitor-like protein [Dyadobacter sp. MSC1_007]|jgi:Raf kinase inhibitor-like YbhB/YbcL family protein|uniref:YbhB/YbcL family Raf kinase inhibitor-like protein n=1 Tax=Dyadobacter sp. MSC1_007 TaxID=2909264 RepID=UPI00202DB751|nr:YbhB/YbcL family Raf kinase inhibitor-like protein [Dyadobacter sp. MSC1_007]
MGTFTLSSNDLGGQFTSDHFFNDWGVGGKNVSPHLYWQNAPQGTKSFAITMYDPAAPTGSGWWHWVLFNIPANVNELASGAGSTEPGLMPAGTVSGMTDFGKPGYGGPVPLPNSGFHPYCITIHALNTELQLEQTASPAMVGFNIGPATIAKASILVYLKV